MEFFLGVSTSLVLFALCAFSYYLGQHNSKPKPAVEVDEQSKRRAEQMERDFQELFNYDLSTAMQRKKVT